MMKLFFLVALVVFGAMAQFSAGVSAGAYYSEQVNVEDVCGPVIVVSYYPNGMPAMCQKTCRHAEWRSFNGGANGFVYQCGPYGCSWVSAYQNSTWWRFNWVNYPVSGPCY